MYSSIYSITQICNWVSPFTGEKKREILSRYSSNILIVLSICQYYVINYYVLKLCALKTSANLAEILYITLIYSNILFRLGYLSQFNYQTS